MFQSQMMGMDAAEAEVSQFPEDSQAHVEGHTCKECTSHCQRNFACRPLVVPEASDVEIHIPFDSRANARVSFDGRNTCRMARGSIVK